MASFLQSRVLFLLLASASGNFLGPIKLDTSKLAPVSLPPATELAKVVQDQVAKASPEQIADQVAKASPEQIAEGLKDTRSAEQGVANAQQATSAALEASASAVSKATSQDVQKALTDAAEVAAGPATVSKVVDDFQGLPTQSPAGLADTLRGATAHVAQAVNRTSLRAAEVISSMGPRAAALLNRTGHEVAGRLSSQRSASSGELLPFDDLLPEEAAERSGLAFCGAALLLALASCGAFVGHRWNRSAARKGPMMLSEALAPLAEASARAPSLQLAASAPQDALLVARLQG